MNEQTTKTRALVWLLVTCVIVFCGVYCYQKTAPVRSLPNSSFLRAARSTVSLDDHMRDVIKRAQRDYFLHPAHVKSPRQIVFVEAVEAPPNDRYFVFTLKGDPAEYVVVYCVAKEDGRLLWKAGMGID